MHQNTDRKNIAFRRQREFECPQKERRAVGLKFFQRKSRPTRYPAMTCFQWQTYRLLEFAGPSYFWVNCLTMTGIITKRPGYFSSNRTLVSANELPEFTKLEIPSSEREMSGNWYQRLMKFRHDPTLTDWLQRKTKACEG